MHTKFLLSTLLSAVQATQLIVPLYLDPSQGVPDGSATAWNTVFVAVANNPTTQFQIILNPNNGPGNNKPGYNKEYITSVAKLNAYPNVHTFGYVHTSYGSRAASTVQTDIARWANWNTYTAANISVNGIFFDEVPNYTKKGNTDVAYMGSLQTYAKSQFNRTSTFQTFYNIGDVCNHAEYFSNMADYVCIFEDNASMFSTAVLNSRLPTGMAAKSCVLLIEYTASGLPSSNITSFLQYFMNLGIGSANILNYGYDQANTPDASADVGSVARILSSK